MTDAQSLPSPKRLLQDLVRAATDRSRLQAFLAQHLADDVKGAVAPRYDLAKPDLIKALTDFISMAARGSISLLDVVEEGTSGSCRILLTARKHDLRQPMRLNAQKDPFFEGAFWLDLDPQGQIKQLTLVGDALTLGMAMGRQMVRAEGG